MDSHESHGDRAALLRTIIYEVSVADEGTGDIAKEKRALSLNISNGGMLVLMDHAPDIKQVLKVHAPTPITRAEAPTLAEVRWTRKLPFGRPKNSETAYFVGLKFMF
ncbi:MAG: PilZ domain-containing protein [Nitrospira sp.]|nr:PilZ domain-containing protein [Nitrospira sp.]MDH5497028.1 PilZ domain-containing protein [Nitrospira sp.]MDH5725138.1 PilZ domain-containing protein [Nitrospira sp.]